MQERRGLSALAVIGMTAVAMSVFSAQLPGTPGGVTAPPSRSQQGAVQKSDQHRIVGKVLQIDREQGLVKLATEEGALVVQASPPMVLAINVGDVISVPRSEAESPSASPRE